MLMRTCDINVNVNLVTKRLLRIIIFGVDGQILKQPLAVGQGHVHHMTGKLPK